MPKKKKIRRNHNHKTLDLHGLSFASSFDMAAEIQLKLDKFFTPLLLSKTQSKATVIVGKGLNSSTSIQGKKPMRYFTEQYLDQVGLAWQNGGWDDGQEGVIVVYFGD